MAANLTRKATQSLTRPLRSRLVVPAVFAISLLLTFVAYFNMRETLALEEQHRLDQAGMELEAQLSHRFAVYTELIEQARGMVLANPDLSPSDWRIFNESIQTQKRFPGIQAVAFVRRILKKDIPQFVSGMRQFKDYTDFSVWPKSEEKYVYPVAMIEPSSWRNRRALGFDMTSEKIRKETLLRALANGSAQLSGLVTLVQETSNDSQPGLVLFTPVFKRGLPITTEAEKDAALLGFICASFRAHDLIRAVLNSTTYYRQIRDQFDIEFFLDEPGATAAQTLLFDTDKLLRTGDEAFSDNLFSQLQFPVGGKTLRASLHTTPAFFESTREFLPTTILLIGLALTLLVTRIIHVNAKQAESLRKSERQLRIVTDALPALISYIDKKLIYRFNNFAYESWFGISRERIVGRAVSEVIGTHNFSLIERALRTALLGKTAEVECEITLANNETRMGRVTYIPDFATDGRVKGVVGLITDISERKRHENRMDIMVNAATMLHGSLEAETTLTRFAQTLVPRLADWVAVHLLEGDERLERVATVHRNPEKAPLMSEVDRKFTHNRFAGNPIWQSIQTREAKLIRYIDPELIAACAATSDDMRTLQEIGFGSLMSIPLLSRGRILGVILMGRANASRAFDIDDLKFASELSQRASLAVDNVRLYREAQTANRSKDEFLATVSHELRTPMNVILGWLEILRNEPADPAMLDQALQTLDRNARIQVELINDLLDVSRIISGKLAISPRKMSIANIVELAIDSVLPAARAKSLIIEDDISGEISPLHADPDRLQQVLWNLLTNSVKFTPPGGKIRVSVKEEDSELLLKIQDTGIGIEPRFLPFVFERFRQEDGSSTRQHGGLGIGLAIVRYLVEAHGGHVSVESEGKGRGTTFTIRLPKGSASVRAQRPEFRLTDHLRVGANSANSRAKHEKVDLAGLKVMLVDDSADVRVLLERVLKKAGAETFVYASAADALKAFEKMEPDVLVSDIGLPEMDGYSFIREIRSRERQSGRKRLPAAALTAFAQARDADLAISSGFDKHIPKPVTAENLTKAVRFLADAPPSPDAPSRAHEASV